MFNIAAAAEILVRNGARISADEPPLCRMRKGKLKDAADDPSTKMSKLPQVDRTQLKIDGNKMIVRLIGGDDRLKVAWSHFMQQKAVASNERLMLTRDVPRSGLLDWPHPGGSDATSCALCWKAFGMMTNRKQVCRVTKRYLCDECSTKRVVDQGQDYRVSDGQYLLAKMEAEKYEREEKYNKSRRGRNDKLHRGSSNSSIGSSGSISSLEENSPKEELFGGIVSRNVRNILNIDDGSNPSMKSKSFRASPSTSKKKASDEVAGVLSSTLGRAKEALSERGSKLNSLSDKSAALRDASDEFAKMAKELADSQQSSSGLFW